MDPLLVYALIEFRQIFKYILTLNVYIQYNDTKKLKEVDFTLPQTIQGEQTPPSICIMLLSTHSLDPCL